MKLLVNVHVPDHGWFGPDYGDLPVPRDAAALITAPGVWVEDPPAATGPPAPVEGAAPSGNVDDVLAWVHGGERPDDPPSAGWQDRALVALDTEEASGRPRKGIVDPLTAALDSDTSR